MKIAYLLYGQLRIRDYDEFFKFTTTMKEKYNVDFYSHVWDNMNEKLFDVSGWNSPIEVKSDALEQIKKNIPFVKLEVSKPITFLRFPELENFMPECTYLYDSINYNNMISQMCSVQRTCKLVDKEYDFYILSRYDIVLNIDRLPDFSLLNKMLIYKEDDFLQIFSNSLLHYYQKCFDNIPYHPGIKVGRENHILNAENLRMGTMRKDGIQEVDHIPYSFITSGRR